MANKSKKLVLLVEDEWMLADAICRKLDSVGYNVIVSHDGAGAMTEVIESKPDIIVLDVFLPTRGGLEFLEQIRDKKETSMLPVIVFSNLSNNQIVERAKQLGIVDYLVKANTSLDDLADKIKGVIG